MTFIDMTNQTLGDLKIIERDYDYGKDKNLKEWNKKLSGNVFVSIVEQK